MLNIASAAARMKRLRDEYLGADVTIEDHPTRYIERCGRIFPLHRISWRVGEQRYGALVESVIRTRWQEGSFMLPGREIAEEDSKATAAAMRQLVRSTVRPLMVAPSRSAY